MKKKIIFITLLALISAIFPPKVYAVNVSISVDSAQKGIAVPTDFLGFSLGATVLCDISKDMAANPVWAQLYKNLGPGVLRIGAGGIDDSYWKPQSPCSKTTGGIGQIAVTTKSNSEVTDLMNFTKNVGWKTIWAVNLTNNNAKDAASEASYVYSQAGSSLLSFEIGNEPAADPKWKNNYSGFKSQWELLAKSIKNAVPSAKFVGPSDYLQDFYKNFVADEKSKLNFASMHYYPAGGRKTATNLQSVNSNEAVSSRSIMLSAANMNTAAGNIKAWVSYAAGLGLPFRLDETNNLSNGGIGGASDVFASALWGTDYLFRTLETGAAGVNFHGVGFATIPLDQPYYKPISDSPSGLVPQPLYYAMLLFHYAAPNGNVVPLTVSSPINVTAHAVVNKNGNLQVVIINKDQAQSASVTVNTTTAYDIAKVIRLTAPSLTTTITSPTASDVKLGGSAVTVNGTWTPTEVVTKNVNGKTASFTSNPLTAMVITYSSKAAPKAGDFNSDGKADFKDLTEIINNFAGHPYTIFDYNNLISNYGK